jgi:hypothetical protein
MYFLPITTDCYYNFPCLSTTVSINVELGAYFDVVCLCHLNVYSDVGSQCFKYILLQHSMEGRKLKADTDLMFAVPEDELIDVKFEECSVPLPFASAMIEVKVSCI